MYCIHKDKNEAWCRESYNTGHYVTTDYNGRNSPFIMHMGSQAEKVRSMEVTATGLPPRITSGFRPPKHPVSTDSSLHQYGYAIDMNPAAAINFIPNRRAMCARVKTLFRNEPRYDVVCHGKGNEYHTHIEYDP